MKTCAECGYSMEDLDVQCRRCQGHGLAPPPKPKSSSLDLSQPRDAFLSTEQSGESTVGALVGLLLSFLPAALITALFVAHVKSYAPLAPNPSYWKSQPEPSLLDHVVYLPFIAVCGAAVGAWIASGLPRFSLVQGAITGAVALFCVALISPLFALDRAGYVELWFIFLIFLGMVGCGSLGGAWRARSGEAEINKHLAGQFGTGLLCFCFPLIGFFAAISLGRNGSDLAQAALYGSIGGLIFVVLPFLLIIS